MKTLLPWAAVIAASLGPTATAARPLAFFGEVGGAPVFVSLDKEGAELSGSYLYLRQARSIRLEGAVGAGGAVTLDEFSFTNGARTGHFEGRPAGADWSGTWRGADGRRVAFVLHPAAAGVSGRLACQARFSASGYRYVDSLRLAAAKGRVTDFSLSQDVTGWGDAQSCSMALGDVTQVPAEAGVVLRGKQDPDGGDAPACAVTLLGGGGWLVVRVGDCRSAGGAMLCSARGSWSDLVADRATQSCKTVQ